MTIGTKPVRAFSFEVSRVEQVTAARIDGAPAELLFRDSTRSRAFMSIENDVFLLTARIR